MAKPEHIQWLREGVDSWNDIRLPADSFRHPDFFYPDFRKVNLFSKLQGSGYEVREVFPSAEGFVLDASI